MGQVRAEVQENQFLGPMEWRVNLGQEGRVQSKDDPIQVKNAEVGPTEWRVNLGQEGRVQSKDDPIWVKNAEVGPGGKGRQFQYLAGQCIGH